MVKGRQGEICIFSSAHDVCFAPPTGEPVEGLGGIRLLTGEAPDTGWVRRRLLTGEAPDTDGFAADPGGDVWPRAVRGVSLQRRFAAQDGVNEDNPEIPGSPHIA